MKSHLECHVIVCNGYAPDFNSGALFVIGGLGCVVTTRPDSLLLNFGHNSLWDIFLEDFRKRALGTFQDLFNKVMALPKGSLISKDPCLKKYFVKADKPYTKSYLRLFPFGSLFLAFGRA